MTGEILFSEVGKIDAGFLAEAEQYRKVRRWDKCRRQPVSVAASVCLTLILTAVEYIL